MSTVPERTFFTKKNWPKLESKRVDLNFREKLIFSVICVHVVLMTLFVADMQQRQRTFLLAAAAESALKQASLTAVAASFWVIADDAAGMDDLLRSSRQDTPVRYAFIMDTRGQILAHTNRDLLGTFINDTEVLKVLQQPKRPHVWRTDTNLIQVAAPVMAEETFLGWVMLGMGTAPALGQLRQIGLDGLMYTLVAIVVGALAAWVLANIALRQLALILRGVDRLQKNELTRPIPVVAQDEIGKVAQALNRAMQSLRQSDERLRREMEERARAQQRIRLLSRRLMDGSEDERKRIGHDLHDELGQSVTGFQFGLHSLRDLLPKEAHEARGLCGKLISYAEEMGDNVRRIAANFWPAALEHMGLIVAGRAFVRECATRHPHLDFIFKNNFPERHRTRRLSPRLELACYRIMQEALTNAIRHARATTVSVSITLHEKDIVLWVHDDGRGFDAQAIFSQDHEELTGIGLIGMYERAAALGGVCDVVSSPGAGCGVKARLPLGPVTREPRV